MAKVLKNTTAKSTCCASTAVSLQTRKILSDTTNCTTGDPIIVCVFTPTVLVTLRSHLSRYHCKGALVHDKSNFTFKCECCDFQEICSERDFLKHLGNHLKILETIQCPFLGCDFKTNTYSTFSSHKSRKHKQYNTKDFRTVIQPCAVAGTIDESDASTCIQQELSHVLEEHTVDNFQCTTIEHKIASFFLSMRTILHVSRSAVQTIIQGFRDILICSKSSACQIVSEVLKPNFTTEHSCSGDSWFCFYV